MRLNGLLFAVPAIFCYLATIANADEQTCYFLDSNRDSTYLVELGILLIKNKYYVFINIDGLRYTNPVDEIFNLTDVNLEPYAWITYDTDGIMVYNAPRPFVDENLKQGLLILPKNDKELRFSSKSFRQLWLNHEKFWDNFFLDFRIGKHGPYNVYENRYIIDQSANAFSQTHECHPDESKTKECVYDQILKIEFVVNREHNDSWKNSFTSYACNVYQESRGIENNFDNVLVRHWYISNLQHGITYTLNPEDAKCYNVDGLSHIFLKKKWLEHPPTRCEYIDVLRNSVKMEKETPAITTSSTKAAITMKEPKEEEEVVPLQWIILTFAIIASIVFCCVCVVFNLIKKKAGKDQTTIETETPPKMKIKNVAREKISVDPTSVLVSKQVSTPQIVKLQPAASNLNKPVPKTVDNKAEKRNPNPITAKKVTAKTRITQ